LHFSSLL